MATTTSVLGLEKPTYQESQDVTVINSNMDKVDAEAGKARGNIASAYSASSAYAVGDYCIYGGNLYRCTTAIGSGGEAWNASHWTQVRIAEDVKAINSDIAKFSPSAYTAPTNFHSNASLLQGGYVKAGKLVVVNCRIQLSNSIDSGTTICNFPSYTGGATQVMVVNNKKLDMNIQPSGAFRSAEELLAGTLVFSCVYFAT